MKENRAMNDVVFCVKCRRPIETDLHMNKVNLNIRNVKFTADEYSVTCKHCRMPVYDTFINDLNVKLRLLAYYNAGIAVSEKDGGTCSR